MSMEMSLSIIIDLRPFDRRWDLSPGIDGGVGRLNPFRYGPSDLTSPDRFWIFSLGRHEKNYPRNICPGCYILDNGDSYSRLPRDVNQVVRLSCQCWLTISIVYARTCSLDIAAQKIMGESSLVFTGLWFGNYFGLHSEKYKSAMKEERV
jgi:hypothetical protein